MTNEEQEQLDLEFFHQAERLTMLPLRITQLQMSHTADMLRRICSVPKTANGKTWSPLEQAIYVMDQVTIESPWEKWEGSPGLKRVHSAKFNPMLATFQGSGGPIECKCAKCHDDLTLILVDAKVADFGTAIVSRNGTLDVVWCDCLDAKYQADLIPNWPQDVKASIERARLAGSRPHRSASEVAQLLGEPRPRASHSFSARPSKRRR
jgi:hypothetical protein